MTSDSRLLSLLGMFGTGSSYTAGELAEQFAVTPRTIRRDITTLRELGYVIDAAPGLSGGYRAGSRTVLPPLQLETGEALATAVGLSLLRGAGLGTAMAETAAAKLRTMLPPSMRTTVGDIDTAVAVLPGHEPDVDHADVVTIASAIAGALRLTFAYTKLTDPNAFERRVEPVRMIVLGAYWYLYAWDCDREAWRVFRLDRMSEVHLTTFTFPPRKHPDAEAAVRAAVTSAAYRYKVRLAVSAPVADAVRWFPTRTASVTESGEGCQVEFGVEDLGWAAVVTARIPVEFTVLTPPELVDALDSLRDRVSRAVDRHRAAASDTAPMVSEG